MAAIAACVTAVSGTKLFVIAIFGCTGDACTGSAYIANRARIVIGARARIVDMLTAFCGVAAVVRANRIVVADFGRARGAFAPGAGIVHCAHTAVIANCCIVGVLATTCRVTAVVGANLTIVACGRRAGLAGAVAAGVAAGALVAVVANSACCHVFTECVRAAGVHGAAVAIVAIAIHFAIADRCDVRCNCIRCILSIDGIFRNSCIDCGNIRRVRTSSRNVFRFGHIGWSISNSGVRLCSCVGRGIT